MWSSKKFSYVYEIRNNVTSEYYIGLSSCNCDPLEHNYLGSGIRIQRCINKYGFELFSKKILKIFNNRKDASAYEAELVNTETLKDPLCLNLKTGGEYIYGVKYHEEVGKLISISLKNFFSIPENRKRLSEWVKKGFKDHPEYGLNVIIRRKKLAKDPIHIVKVKAARKKLFEETNIREKLIIAFNKEETKIKKRNSIKKYLSTDKGKENISNATKNTVYINNGTKTKRVKREKLNEFLAIGWTLGSLLSPNNDTRKKISKIFSGRIWVYNEKLQKNKRIKSEDFEKYIENGWIKGYIKWKK